MGMVRRAAYTKPGKARVSHHGRCRQDDLVIRIDHNQPLQKVFVARLPTRMLLDTAYEIGADGMLRKPGSVDSYIISLKVKKSAKSETALKRVKELPGNRF